jgi:hypothetical protein
VRKVCVVHIKNILISMIWAPNVCFLGGYKKKKKRFTWLRVLEDESTSRSGSQATSVQSPARASWQMALKWKETMWDRKKAREGHGGQACSFI